MANTEQTPFAKRFRGFFPVVIDVETAGFNKETDALLEIAASVLKMYGTGNAVIRRPILTRFLKAYHTAFKAFKAPARDRLITAILLTDRRLILTGGYCGKSSKFKSVTP